MNSSQYLKSYGWNEGEALQKGGLKKPILVKHKKDRKGIGHQPNGGADAWWERLFDGQLKALDVSTDSKDGLSFKQESYVASGVPVAESPLYRMFVRGETLEATNGKTVSTKRTTVTSTLITADLTQIKTGFNSAETGKKEKKDKKDKKEKKEKKDKSDKKDTKEKKEKSEKVIEKKEKKTKKSVKDKTVNDDKVKKDKADKKSKKEKTDDETRKSKKRKSDDSQEPKKKKKSKA